MTQLRTWTIGAWSGWVLGLLVVGCGSGGHQPLPVFEPGDDTYRSVTAALAAPRADATVTRVGSMTVLIAGGTTAREAATRSAEVFDAATGTTRVVPVGLTTARVGHFAVGLDDGRVLIGGGRDAQDRPLDSLEVYDPTEDRFTALPQRLRRPRDRAGVAVVGSRLLVAGGRFEASLEQVSLGDFTTQLIAEELPGGPRIAPQLVALDDATVFLYGGGGPAVWCDLAAGTQTPAQNAEVVRDGTVVRWPRLSRDGLVIVGGEFGTRDSRTFQIVTPDDTPTAWPRFAKVGLFHSRNAPAVLVTRRGLLVFGGTLQGAPVVTGERQDIAGNELLPDGSGARRDPSAVLLDGGVIALIGGRGADGRPSALVDVVLPPQARMPDGLKAFRDAAQAGAELSEVDAAIGAARAERAATGAEAVRRRTELTAARAELATAEAALRDLIAQRARNRDAAAAAQARTRQLMVQVGIAAQQRDQLRRSAAAADAERAQAAARLRDLQAQLAAAQEGKTAAEDAVRRLDPQILAAQRKLIELRRTVPALRAQR